MTPKWVVHLCSKTTRAALKRLAIITLVVYVLILRKFLQSVNRDGELELLVLDSNQTSVMTDNDDDRYTQPEYTSERIHALKRTFTIKGYGFRAIAIHPNGSRSEEEKLGAGLFHKCPYFNCELVREQNASAVIIDLIHTKTLTFPPQAEFAGQRWFAYNIEPAPHYTHQFLFSLRNIFHYSVSYNSRSDILIKYNSFAPLTDDERAVYSQQIDQDDEGIRSRKKLAIWLVSNCRGQSLRLAYGKELMRHMPIDVYGDCGNLTCPRVYSPDNPCLDLMAQYKFYIAFENSICDGYITEKPWKVLMLGVVPIVLGGVNYRTELPPHSYIDITDYESPEQLANHIKYLDQNMEEYMKYLDWRREYRVYGKDYAFACQLCQFLNELAFKSPAPRHIDPDWVWSVNETCKTPEDYYGKQYRYVQEIVRQTGDVHPKKFLMG